MQERAQQQNREDSFEDLLDSYHKLIKSVALKFSQFGPGDVLLDPADLEQEGKILLWELYRRQQQNGDIEDFDHYFHNALSHIPKVIWRKVTHCNLVPLGSISSLTSSESDDEEGEQLDIEAPGGSWEDDVLFDYDLRMRIRGRISALADRVLEILLDPPQDLAHVYHVKVLRVSSVRRRLGIDIRAPRESIVETCRTLSSYLSVPKCRIRRAIEELRRVVTA